MGQRLDPRVRGDERVWRCLMSLGSFLHMLVGGDEPRRGSSFISLPYSAACGFAASGLGRASRGRAMGNTLSTTA